MTCICCSQGHAPPAQLASAQLFAAKLGTGPQRVVMLKGMTRAITLFNQKDQDEVGCSNNTHMHALRAQASPHSYAEVCDCCACTLEFASALRVGCEA